MFFEAFSRSTTSWWSGFRFRSPLLLVSLQLLLLISRQTSRVAAVAAPSAAAAAGSLPRCPAAASGCDFIRAAASEAALLWPLSPAGGCLHRGNHGLSRDAQQCLLFLYVSTRLFPGVRTPDSVSFAAGKPWVSWRCLRYTQTEQQRQPSRRIGDLLLQQKKKELLLQATTQLLLEPVTQLLLPKLPLVSELLARSPQRQQQIPWEQQLKIQRRKRGLVAEEDPTAIVRAGAAEMLQQFTALLTQEMKLAVAALRVFPQQLPGIQRALVLLSLVDNKKLLRDRFSRMRLCQRQQQLQSLQQQCSQLQPQQQVASSHTRLQKEHLELQRQLRIHQELGVLPRRSHADGLLQQQHEEELQKQLLNEHEQQQQQQTPPHESNSNEALAAAAALAQPKCSVRKQKENEQQQFFEREKHLLQGKEKVPDRATVYDDLRALYIELVSQGKAYAAQVRLCKSNRQIKQRYQEGINALRKVISTRKQALLNYRIFASYIHLHVQQRCSLHRLNPQVPQILLVGGPNVGKSSLFAALTAANEYVHETASQRVRQAAARREAEDRGRQAAAAMTDVTAVAEIPAAATPGGDAAAERVGKMQATGIADIAAAGASMKTTAALEDAGESAARWDLSEALRLELRAMRLGRALAFETAADGEDAVCTAAAAQGLKDLYFYSTGDPAARAAEAAAARTVVEPYGFSTQGLLVGKLFERKRRGSADTGETYADVHTAALPVYRCIGQLIDAPPLLLRAEGEGERNVFEKMSLSVLSHLPCGVFFLFDCSGLPRRQLTEQQLQLLQQQPTSVSLRLLQQLLEEEEQVEETETSRQSDFSGTVFDATSSSTVQSLTASLHEDNDIRSRKEDNDPSTDDSSILDRLSATCRDKTKCNLSTSRSSSQYKLRKDKQKKRKGSCPLNLLQQLALRNQLRQRFPKRPWVDIIAKADLLNVAQLLTARALLPPCLLLSTYQSADSLLQVQRHARVLLQQLGRITEKRTASVEQEQLLQQQCERQQQQQDEQQRINEALRFYADRVNEAANDDRV